MKILVKFKRFNVLAVLLFSVLCLSGCAVKEKLRWLDNKIGAMVFNEQFEVSDMASSTETDNIEKIDFRELTREQKEEINQWLKENNFNRYGDAVNTMYAGGTPLFNELTGEAIDRFEYILKKVPDVLGKIE